MPLNVYKQIDRPDHISLLVLTRGHPDGLQEMLNSIEETACEKRLLDVWIYVDDDDETTIPLVNTFPFQRFGFPVHWVVGKRTGSMGEMLNDLRMKCTTNPGIYMPMPDDYRIDVAGWDDIVRSGFRRYSDRIVLCYPTDPIAGEDQITFCVLSAEWTNALGRIATEYFPFWGDDTWLDEVSQMVQRKIRLDLTMKPRGGKGKTPRMRNELFWHRFYESVFRERMEDADRLLATIHEGNMTAYIQGRAEAQTIHKRIQAGKIHYSDIELLDIENRLAESVESGVTAPPSPSYREIEHHAVRHLEGKLWQCIRRGRFREAIDLWSAILCASESLKGSRYQRSVWPGRLERIHSDLHARPVWRCPWRLICRFIHWCRR